MKEQHSEFVNNYEIVRLNIRDMKGAVFTKTEEKLREERIVINSSEVVRVVTRFSPQNTKVDKAKNVKSRYPFIKDLISLKIGKAYNKYYDNLCKAREESEQGIFVLNIVKYDEEKKSTVIESIRYKRILCGSSFIRSTKELYIRETLYDDVMNVLLTGIAKDAMLPNSKRAKYSTYMGLAATNSKPVSMPNLCVVKDYKKMIKDAFDIVIQKDLGENKFLYEVKNFIDTKKESEEEINCFDGAGIVSYERACIWAKELGLDYVPASFQIRVLPGIKGNLYTFPVTEYIEYLESLGMQDKLTICDLWGDMVDVKEKKIDVFLTESQFKFHAQFQNFEQWKNAFEKGHKHNRNVYYRTFNICDYSKDISELKSEVWSAYQPLQTIDLLEDEIKEITEPTVEKLRLIYTDVNEFLKYRGLLDETEAAESRQFITKDSRVPYYYQALKMDDSLQYDSYIRKKIKADLESLKKRILSGKILLDGNYQTAIPDLLALMEHIFGLEVVGALNKWEVYSNYWLNKGIDKISIWRNPHIACEWCNVKVVSNKKTKWFKYQMTGYVTDIYSTLALRLGTMDFDGDTVAGIHSEAIYNAVERADIHTIRLITEKKETQKKEDFCIADTDKIMYTNKLGFQNNIGEVTNKVTKLWAEYGNASSDEKEIISDNIKVMSIINQLIIDFVKTGIKVPIPENIIDKVSDLKFPEFMKYREHNYVNDQKVRANAKTYEYLLNNMEEKEEYVAKQMKYQLSKGTVDRIYCYIRNHIDDMEMEFDATTEECQFTKLMTEIPYIYNVTYKNLREKMHELQEKHNRLCGKKYYEEKADFGGDRNLQRFASFYNFCEMELSMICKEREKLLNYLIYLFYTDAEFRNCDKAILWNVFGRDICMRYQSKSELNDEILTKLKKYETKAEKQAETLKKQCSQKNIVHIKNLPNVEIVITDREIDYIAHRTDDKEAGRLMLALLVLYKKINIENDDKKRMYPVKISKGKKSEVTKNQLCKLADIYYNQFDNRIKALYDRKLIDINLSNLKIPKIYIKIPELDKFEKSYSINDINEIFYIVKEHMF